jgi:hypothetical protein
MQEINNVNFNAIRVTRKLNVSCYDSLYDSLNGGMTIQELVVRAFELGASLDNQEKKKVCMLCKSPE